MARRRNPYRPGTPSHEEFRRAALRRRLALQEAAARRARRPEVRRQAFERVRRTRSTLRQLPEHEATIAYRRWLFPDRRSMFDRLPRPDQRRLVELLRRHPKEAPPRPGRQGGELIEFVQRRNAFWLYYRALGYFQPPPGL